MVQRNNIYILAATVVLFASCAGIRYSGTPVNSIEKEAYTLTFSDEFNGGPLDTSKWLTRYYWMNVEPFTSYKGEVPKDYFDKDQLVFTDSTVQLWVDRDTTDTGTWEIPFRSSGLDNSKSFEQRYGYFEIKCKMPQTPGYWPAFWLISTHIYPPEVDIFEIYTSRRKPYTYSHHWKVDGERDFKTVSNKLRNCEGFNVYACEWNEEEVKFYFNNQLVGTLDAGVGPQQFYIGTVPMHLIINNVAEEPESSQTKTKKLVYPGYMEVDYVRVYQKNARLP